MTVTVSNDLGTLIGIGIYLLIFLAGLRAFVLGFRGKKIDNHPLCAKCRFDLTGLPQDQESCPECGANLLRRKSIVTGNRKRESKRIYKGLIVMAAVLALTGPRGWQYASQIDWFRHAPVWYLRNQINKDTPLAMDSWLILLERYDKDNLWQTQKQAIVEDALKLHADLSRKWYSDAGDLIEKFHEDGGLTQQQWDQYRQTILDQLYAISYRPKIEHGKWLPVREEIGRPRIGKIKLWCKRDCFDFYIDGQLVYQKGAGNREISQDSRGRYSYSLPIKSSIWEKLEPGEHVVTARMHCTVYDQALNPLPEVTRDLDILEYDLAFEKKIEVLPKGTSSVLPVVDENLKEQMSNAISVKLACQPAMHHMWDVEMKFLMLPVPVAFDISIRHQDQIKQMGRVYSRAGGEHNWVVGKKCELDIKDGDQVDVILTPNPKVAERSTYVVEYWNLPIVIKDVPVTIK